MRVLILLNKLNKSNGVGTLSESLVAIGISIFSLFIAIVSLWLSQLRGPSIAPVGNIEKGIIALRPEVMSRVDLTRIPFNVGVTLANNSGSTGIVRCPKVFFTPEKGLEDEGLGILMEGVHELPSLKPKTESSGDFTASIPAYSVKTVTIDCVLSLLPWRDLPPKESFTTGCKLMAIHLGHFDANRKRILELISKLEMSKKIGTIKVTLMVTEKAFPIIGRMKWKEEKFIDSLEIRLDQDYSLGQLREKVGGWKFDYNYQLSLYLNFLDYVINQGTAILDTLKNRSSSPSHTAFPEDIYPSSFARETLSRKDQEFSELWKELSTYREIYPDILRSLEDQNRGRPFTDKDESNMKGLQEALEKTLRKCKVLRGVVVDEFRYDMSRDNFV